MQVTEVKDHLEELIAGNEIPDDTKELVPVKSGVKKWAAENAYLLIYIALTALLSDIALVLYYYATH